MKVSEIFDSFCAAQFQPAERDIFKLFQLFLFLTGIAFAYFTLKYSQTRFVGYCLLFLFFFFHVKFHSQDLVTMLPYEGRKHCKTIFNSHC